MVARSAFVFDLFHTLVDTEHLRPRGFRAVTAAAVFGRSCDIGAMKPDLRPYRWMATQLRIEPGQSVYVGNGSSDELAGARQAGFGYIVHCNIFDHSNGLVEPEEQLRRARQADTTVDTVDELDDALAIR